MKNPLATIDELVLNHVFEPITQKVNKDLGWTKYDLVRLTDKSTGAIFMGSGLYYAIPVFSNWAYFPNAILGTIAVGIGMSITAFGGSDVEDKEKEELNDYLASGAVKAPTISSIRPISLFAVAPLLTAQGMTATYDPSSGLEQVPYYTAIAGFTLCGIVIGMSDLSSYFSNTTFIPPGSSKKKLWRSIYESILEKMPKVKANEPITVENKYETYSSQLE